MSSTEGWIVKLNPSALAILDTVAKLGCPSNELNYAIVYRSSAI